MRLVLVMKTDETPLFDRISILILSIEWIFFGSMHFSAREQTIAMLPSWIPESVRPFIVTSSGMIEVSIGILILVAGARRWAALGSLCLLVLYIPAVYQILANDEVFKGSPFLTTAFRVALMPNNIFLGICSVYLWQHPEASLARMSTAAAEVPVRTAGGRTGLATLLVALLMLMSNCAGFLGVLLGAHANMATACLWAMMCIATGALLGFLFAVPRTNPSVKLGAYLLPNENIEAVSDWLTKILIGVGLINFKEIGGFTDGLADRLALSLQGDAAAPDKSFALSLIVYFFVVGLIQGYLLTRLFLSSRFSAEYPAAGTSSQIP